VGQVEAGGVGDVVAAVHGGGPLGGAGGGGGAGVHYAVSCFGQVELAVLHDGERPGREVWPCRVGGVEGGCGGGGGDGVHGDCSCVGFRRKGRC